MLNFGDLAPAHRHHILSFITNEEGCDAVRHEEIGLDGHVTLTLSIPDNFFDEVLMAAHQQPSSSSPRGSRLPNAAASPSSRALRSRSQLPTQHPQQKHEFRSLSWLHRCMDDFYAHYIKAQCQGDDKITAVLARSLQHHQRQEPSSQQERQQQLSRATTTASPYRRTTATTPRHGVHSKTSSAAKHQPSSSTQFSYPSGIEFGNSQSFSVSLFHFISKRYGVSSIVQKTGKELLASIKRWRFSDLDVHLFGIFLAHPEYDPLDVCFAVTLRNVLRRYAVNKQITVTMRQALHSPDAPTNNDNSETAGVTHSATLVETSTKSPTEKFFIYLQHVPSLLRKCLLPSHRAVWQRTRAALTTWCDSLCRFPSIVAAPQFYVPPFTCSVRPAQHVPFTCCGSAPSFPTNPYIGNLDNYCQNGASDLAALERQLLAAEERFTSMNPNCVVEVGQIVLLMLMNFKQERVSPLPQRVASSASSSVRHRSPLRDATSLLGNNNNNNNNSRSRCARMERDDEESSSSPFRQTSSLPVHRNRASKLCELASKYKIREFYDRDSKNTAATGLSVEGREDGYDGVEGDEKAHTTLIGEKEARHADPSAATPTTTPAALSLQRCGSTTGGFIGVSAIRNSSPGRSAARHMATPQPNVKKMDPQPTGTPSHVKDVPVEWAQLQLQQDQPQQHQHQEENESEGSRSHGSLSLQQAASSSQIGPLKTREDSLRWMLPPSLPSPISTLSPSGSFAFRGSFAQQQFTNASFASAASIETSQNEQTPPEATRAVAKSTIATTSTLAIDVPLRTVNELKGVIGEH